MIRGKKEEADKSALFKTLRPKKNFSGKTPNILIGTFGYPQVSVGALTSETYENDSDNPKSFIQENRSIQEIIEGRQSLVNSMQKLKVQGRKEKLKEQAQEIAKSSAAVDTEVELDRPLLRRVEFHEKALPHGPSATLKKLELTQNIKIPKIIEEKTSETDLLANTAIAELQEKGTDEYHLTKLLSAGTLGKEENKKLVPTKWAITAVDDKLAETIREQILDHPFADYGIYEYDYIGNHYTILVMPGEWSFELVEYIAPNTIHNSSPHARVCSDHEFVQGRKNYAEETAGGYYAARLPALRKLKEKKLQARVLVIRVITDKYTAPLGVWTVRETVTHTLEQKPQPIDSKNQLIKEAYSKLKLIGVVKPEELLKESAILREIQAGLKRWI